MYVTGVCDSACGANGHRAGREREREGRTHAVFAGVAKFMPGDAVGTALGKGDGGQEEEECVHGSYECSGQKGSDAMLSEAQDSRRESVSAMMWFVLF